MKRFLIFIAAIGIFTNFIGYTQDTKTKNFLYGKKLEKPRIINMTDLGADPDDEQSMVRFLVQSNEFDVEGLIVTTGCWKKSQTNINTLTNILNA